MNRRTARLAPRIGLCAVMVSPGLVVANTLQRGEAQCAQITEAVSIPTVYALVDGIPVVQPSAIIGEGGVYTEDGMYLGNLDGSGNITNDGVLTGYVVYNSGG